eukprot:2384852-Pyramimonas_sp.AAC.2
MNDNNIAWAAVIERAHTVVVGAGGEYPGSFPGNSSVPSTSREVTRRRACRPGSSPIPPVPASHCLVPHSATSTYLQRLFLCQCPQGPTRHAPAKPKPYVTRPPLLWLPFSIANDALVGRGLV